MTPEDVEQLEKGLTGLLAAVRKPPMPLSEKLSAADILRKWAYLIGFTIVAATISVVNIRANTARLNEIYPMVKAMDWMKTNGYTNKDVEPYGPIRLPKF